MEPYFLYHNWRRDRVRIHRGGCRYCDFGKGQNTPELRVDDEWLGPFGRQEAFQAARRLRREDVAACAACRP